MEIELPDGTIVEFPEGTSPEVIKQALRKQFPSAENPNNARAAAARAGTLEMQPGSADRQAKIDADAMVAMRDPGMSASALLGATQGATFGFGDEAIAALLSASPNMTYDQALAATRGLTADARAANPVTTTAAEIAGGIGSGLAGGLGAIGAGGSLAARSAIGAGVGAAEGGLYGFGSGEGGLANRAQSAGESALVGGAVGAAAPGLIAGARMVGDAVKTPVMSALNIGSNTQASRAIEQMMQRSGMSADDLQRAMHQATQEGQPEYMLADALGTSGQRGLSGVARQPGDARQQIADFMSNRQLNQGNRLSGFLAEGLGAPDTAAARVASLTQARGDEAAKAYAAARQGAGPVDVRGAVGAIDQRVGPMRGSGVALDGIDKRLEGFRNRLTARNPAAPNLSVELSDFDRVLGVKQDLGDAIGEAVRAGRNNEARELMGLQKQLDAALEGASDGYRTANDNFAKASRSIDAVGEGSAATSGRVRADDVAGQYSAMTPDQQSAFRAGYADPLIAKILYGTPT